MNLETLQLLIDSKAGQQDLLKLAKALDTTGLSVQKLDRTFTTSANAIDAAITKSTRAIAKYAEVIALMSQMKVAANPSQGIGQLATAMAAIKGPSPATIRNMQAFMQTLSQIKPMPGVAQFAKNLDLIAASASRAGAALATLPRQMQTYGSANNAAAQATKTHATNINTLAGGLSLLTGRFSLAYQAGTLFTSVFSVFTLGAFIRDVYETNNQFLKLQKAVLFATGTFAGASKATDEYIGIEQRLGLSIKENIEYYGRFVIAAKASGMTLEQTNKTYAGVETALTVVGASSQQASLALYGLTEMMQKGVVYSKEFNRQIGAQLPGNAVLGARALSQLRGQAVSVSDFFKEMHKGTLMSADFVPAWAAEVEKMYKPLLELAQKRPDVALTRLQNSFTMFIAAIGNGAFGAAIGTALNEITDKIMYLDKEGVAHLRPQAQALADMLGKNLADGVRTLGSALAWLADHMQGVMTVVRAVVAFELGKILFAWGASAVTAAAGVGRLTASLLGLKAAQTGVAVTGVATTAASALSYGPPTAAAAAAAAAAGAGAARSSSVAATIGGVATGFARLLGVLGLVVLAFEAIDFVFGSWSTGQKTLQGDTVTLHDGLMALIEPLKLLGSGFSYLVNLIPKPKGGPQTQEQILNSYLPDKKKGEIVGGFTRAQLFAMPPEDAAALMSAGGLAANTLEKAHTRAQASAHAPSQSEIDQKRIETVLRNQNSAQKIADAAQAFQDGAAIFKGSATEVSTSDLMKQLKSAAAGTDVGLNPEGASAQNRATKLGVGKAGNSNYTIDQIMGIIIDAAKTAGVDPGLAERIAFRENSFRPDIDNGNARGLFQIEDKTAAGFLKNHPDFESTYGTYDAHNPAQNAMMAMMLQRDDQKYVESKGIQMNATEGYLTHLLGGPVAAQLLSAFQSNPYEQTRDVLGTPLFNQVSSKNPWAFFDGKRERNVQETYGAIVDSSKNTADPLMNARIKAAMDSHGFIPSIGAMTDDQAEAWMKKQDEDKKKLSALVAKGSPSEAADAEVERMKTELQDLKAADLDQRLKAGPGTPSVFAGRIKDVQEALARKQILAERAHGPIQYAADLQEKENQITLDSVHGLSEQAGWQEKVNALIEKGESTVIAYAEAGKKAFLQTQINTNALHAQVDAIQTLNTAQVNLLSRTEHDPIQDYINKQIEANHLPGESLDDARRRLSQKSAYGFSAVDSYGIAAVAQAKDRTGSVLDQAQNKYQDYQAQIGMNPQQREIYDAYRTTLGQMVGDTSGSLATIEKEAQAQFGRTKDGFNIFSNKAMEVAKQIHEMQNPDGFQRWADGLDSFEKRLNDIKYNFASGLSDGITDALMGDKFDWGAFAKSIQKEFVKGSVDDMLSGVFQGLGITKPMSPQEKLGAAGTDLSMSANNLTGAADSLSLAAAALKSGANGGGGGSGWNGGGGGYDQPADFSYPLQAPTMSPYTLNPNDPSFGMPSLGGSSSIQPADFSYPIQAPTITPDPLNLNDPQFAMPNIGASVGGSLDGSTGGGGLFSGSFGRGLAGLGLEGAISGLEDLFTPSPSPVTDYPAVNGIIGTASTNTVSGTEVAGHANTIGSILNAVAQIGLASATGGASGSGFLSNLFNGGGGLGTTSNWLLNLFGGGLIPPSVMGPGSLTGKYSEGGYVGSPVSTAVMSGVNFAALPHYSEGTANTSGGIPSILHPNEAVIPLSRGRKIPVEMSGQNGVVMNSNITIVANDPNTFRKSSSAIERQQNKALKRNAVRNLISI